MVDTADYKDYMPGVWQDTNTNGLCDTNETDCVSVPGDHFFYAIYDESRRCNGVDLGCSRMGQAVSSGTTLDFSDVYKRNNPNNYSQSLCNSGDAGCEAWKYVDGSGTSYFKNPGNNACVYRTSTDATRPGKDWYKVPVMRCDFNNNGKIDGGEKTTPVCSSSFDCLSERPCLVDNNDYACASSYFETIGLGGGGNGSNSTSGAAGTANTGGGGGGSSQGTVGANGGSGIVIFYIPTANYTGITTGSPTVTTSGTNTILKFTASGSYTA